MNRNLAMMTDLYQLTMMYGYHRCSTGGGHAVFDLFFREIGEQRAYAVMAGVESVVHYINKLQFTPDDISYLRSLCLFDETFLRRLSTFRFSGDIYAMPEGTIVFPREPLLRIKAPIFEAQLIETALLTFINHQTLIATKASRIKYAAGNDTVMEFGARRAQGIDAAVTGSRAAVIGGCSSTSNVQAGKLFGIPVSGTHAHSWVMSFPDELSAFNAYADIFPDSCTLLVDTYDTLKTGIPNAIAAFDRLRAKGKRPVGIRIDSGDLAYISKMAREMLDAAGYTDVKICASGDLDEYVIRELKMQDAKIDIWGVGTRLITSSDCPALGGVYKLAAEEVCGRLIPRIKVSENPIKVTLPGYKKVFRLYSRSNDMAYADLITLEHESVDETRPLTLYDPIHRYKSVVLENFYARDMLVPVFINGEQVIDLPDINAICAYAQTEQKSFWDEYKRLMNPHAYKVDLSDALYDLKERMLRRYEPPEQ